MSELVTVNQLQRSASKKTAARKFDFVIVCARDEQEVKAGCCGTAKHILNRRLYVEENLRAAGLQMSTVKSSDDHDYLIRVTATQQRLEHHAEHMRLEIPTLLPQEEGDTEVHFGDPMAFDSKKRSMFPADFSSSIRSQIIQDIIEGEPRPYPGRFVGYDSGAGLPLAKRISEGTIKAGFALHEPAARKSLMTSWVKRFWTMQPLDSVRDYFGEKVALYFAFIGYYTAWLIPPAVVGLVIWIMQLSYTASDSVVTPLYAIAIMLWATLFLEFWKRENAGLAHKWNVLGFEETNEPARPTFHGVKQYGFYVKNGGWVSLEDELVEGPDGKVDRYSRRPIEENFYTSSAMRTFKYLLASPILGGLLVAVSVVSLAVLQLRVVMIGSTFFSGVLAFSATGLNAALNAVCIIILNILYQKLAVVLTNWENHRTQSEYEDALITKTFLFQFINSYFTLFYIAFFKGKYPLCIGSNCRPDSCVGNDCFAEVSQSLLIIFGVKALALQAMEVVIPFIQWFVSRKMAERRARKLAESGQKPIKQSQAEVESRKPQYESTFDDYNELAIQFGYVMLFACALPLAPLMALASNVIEIRSDAFRLLRLMQRPSLGRAEDIGTWFRILEVLSYVGIVTNCFLLAFTSNAFAPAFGLTITQRVWFAFILEHCLILAKLVIMAVIPDVPGYIKKELAKKAWIRERQLVALESAQHPSAPPPPSIALRTDDTAAAAAASSGDQDVNLDVAEDYDDHE